MSCVEYMPEEESFEFQSQIENEMTTRRRERMMIYFSTVTFYICFLTMGEIH